MSWYLSHKRSQDMQKDLTGALDKMEAERRAMTEALDKMEAERRTMQGAIERLQAENRRMHDTLVRQGQSNAQAIHGTVMEARNMIASSSMVAVGRVG